MSFSLLPRRFDFEVLLASVSIEQEFSSGLTTGSLGSLLVSFNFLLFGDLHLSLSTRLSIFSRLSDKESPRQFSFSLYFSFFLFLPLVEELEFGSSWILISSSVLALRGQGHYKGRYEKSYEPEPGVKLTLLLMHMITL